MTLLHDDYKFLLFTHNFTGEPQSETDTVPNITLPQNSDGVYTIDLAP
tara:strand:- start:245 stop:388 length:144 start_codon:yes stop_codon:yes gene_type:complete